MVEFRGRVEIEAPPEVVYEYLVTEDGLTAWMGRRADLDPTPGGRFAVVGAGGEAGPDAWHPLPD